MLSAPMCVSTRCSEAPPSGSYNRGKYARLHTRTTIGACEFAAGVPPRTCSIHTAHQHTNTPSTLYDDNAITTKCV